MKVLAAITKGGTTLILVLLIVLLSSILGSSADSLVNFLK